MLRLLPEGHFRMRAQEMMQCMQERGGMRAVMLGLRSANVVDNHVTHFFKAVRRMAESAVRELCTRYGLKP